MAGLSKAAYCSLLGVLTAEPFFSLPSSSLCTSSLLFFLAANQVASGFSPLLLCGFRVHRRVELGSPEVNANPMIGKALRIQSKDGGLGFFFHLSWRS